MNNNTFLRNSYKSMNKDSALFFHLLDVCCVDLIKTDKGYKLDYFGERVKLDKRTLKRTFKDNKTDILEIMAKLYPLISEYIIGELNEVYNDWFCWDDLYNYINKHKKWFDNRTIYLNNILGLYNKWEKSNIKLDVVYKHIENCKSIPNNFIRAEVA